MPISQFSDLGNSNDPAGRTLKQINAELTHSWPVGALVEISYDGAEDNGVRMFIAELSRDCDQTPLYYLTPRCQNIGEFQFYNAHPAKRSQYLHYRRHLDGGFSEGSLTLISLPTPERLASIAAWYKYNEDFGRRIGHD